MIRLLIIFIPYWLLCHSVMADDNLKQLTIVSEITNQSLNVEVRLPDNYNQNQQRYPVFYTTAGSRRLPLLKAQIEWLSHVQFAPLPQVILVTLPQIEAGGSKDKFARASGAGDQLAMDVYEKELLPYIDKHFRTQPYRMVEGFSGSANLLLAVFASRPQLFNAYFAFSPAFALDKSGLMEKLQHLKPGEQYRHRGLYVSLGNFAENKAGFEQLTQLFNRWHKQGEPTLELYTDNFSSHNYLSGPVLGVVKGAENLFADRQPQAADFAESGIEGLKAHFQTLRDKYGYSLSADNSIMDLAFYYAGQQCFEEAEQAINVLLEKQPDSVYLLTRLADIQKQGQNIEHARGTLGKALKLAESQGSEEAIGYIHARLAELN